MKYLDVVITSRAGIDVCEGDMEEALALMEAIKKQEPA